uniref:Globin domain-containing protein n=1 Tax=Lygus hesperus TaxID=30085 RepID=A0A0K8S6X2_LYGHE
MEATPEQVAMVKKAFDPLSVDAPGVGKVFFERLFELYPGSQKYFQHLGSTDEELFANPVFQHHCTKVILSVGTMIDNYTQTTAEKTKSCLRNWQRFTPNGKFPPSKHLTSSIHLWTFFTWNHIQPWRKHG